MATIQYRSEPHLTVERQEAYILPPPRRPPLLHGAPGKDSTSPVSPMILTETGSEDGAALRACVQHLRAQITKVIYRSKEHKRVCGTGPAHPPLVKLGSTNLIGGTDIPFEVVKAVDLKEMSVGRVG